MFSSSILHKDITTSTMKDARDALESGYGHGTVCSARSQTMGRGRITGRRWIDDDGGALLFTLILKKSFITVSYPLTQLMALALCRRLEKGFGLTPRIKWPNDVLVDGKKISGILVEMEGDYYLAGMGMNVFQTEFPSELRRPAISLAQVVSQKQPGKTSLCSLSEEMNLILMEIENHIGISPGIEEVESRLLGLHQMVDVLLGDPSRRDTLSGTIAGLQNDGALLIKSKDGEIRAVYSGEIDYFDSFLASE